MTEEDHAEDPLEQRGVFGSLPDSRPALRSPRRRGGEQAGGAETPPPVARSEAPEPEARAGGGSVEDLAWTGIAVAAEAATLGVRLLTRAVDAVHRPADRR
jgi:hypothetical protein